MQTTMDNTPWYRQFWAWFVIIPPIVAIVAGTATVLIANHYADNLVTGDFEKVGLGYQSTSAARAEAARLGITAEVALPSGDDTLRLWLSGAHAHPQQLIVTLAHATQGEKDQRLTVVRVDGERYEGRLPAAVTDRHYLIISHPEEVWRLEGRMAAGATHARLGTGNVTP